MSALLQLMICSPSGAGKTTLTRHLLATFEGLAFSVSHTTRSPRGSEQDGRDYHFVERSRFEELVAANQFAEWAEVHGNLYGTALSEIDRAKRDGKMGIIFDIDVQGARQIRANVSDAVGLFVLPPSMEELRRRLIGRGTDASEVIARRLAKAREEISHYAFFDYLLVNDDLERSRAIIEGIVRAELARRPRTARHAESLLRTTARPSA